MDRVSIVELNLVAITRLNTIDDATNCALCGENLLAPSSNELEKKSTDITDYVGKCGHAFHKICIETYVKNNESCPVCKTPWTLAECVPFNDILYDN